MNGVIVYDNKCVFQRLDFVRNLTYLTIYRFEGKIMELYYASKFNNMTSLWHQITSLCQSSYAQMLEMNGTLFCAILIAVLWVAVTYK